MKLYVEEPLHDFIAIARIAIRAVQPQYKECANDALLHCELEVLDEYGLASMEGVIGDDLLDWEMTDKLRRDIKRNIKHEWDPLPDLVVGDSLHVHDCGAYFALFEHMVSVNYKVLTKSTYEVWQQVKLGDLVRVLTDDGRRTWQQTPQRMFCDVANKEVPKEYRPIFKEMQRRGLLKVSRTDGGSRAWFPTALGEKRGLGASVGSAFKLLRDLGYKPSERDICSDIQEWLQKGCPGYE